MVSPGLLHHYWVSTEEIAAWYGCLLRRCMHVHRMAGVKPSPRMWPGWVKLWMALLPVSDCTLEIEAQRHILNVVTSHLEYDMVS